MSRCIPITDSALETMLAKMARRRDRVLLLCGVRMGFRISEILSLTVGDVWGADGQPKREVTISRRLLKNGRAERKRQPRSRSVPVTDDLAAEIAAYMHERSWAGPVQPTEPLFPSRKGGRPIARRQAFEVLVCAADYMPRIGTHSMRRTFANAVYRASGNDIVLTQEALGHRSPVTTSVYLNVRADAVREAILAVGRLEPRSA